MCAPLEHRGTSLIRNPELLGLYSRFPRGFGAQGNPPAPAALTTHAGAAPPVYKDTSPIRKCPPPQDPPGTPGTGLR